jgi:serine/threonine protein kinase
MSKNHDPSIFTVMMLSRQMKETGVMGRFLSPPMNRLAPNTCQLEETTDYNPSMSWDMHESSDSGLTDPVEVILTSMDDRKRMLIERTRETVRNWATSIARTPSAPRSLHLHDQSIGIVHELIGGGGTAECWSAHVERADEPVIAKCFRPGKEEFAVKELHALRQVISNCVPAPKGSGTTDNGRKVVCMEQIHGVPWAVLLEDMPDILPQSALLPLFAETTEALRTVHTKFIHRDLKPGNLLLGAIQKRIHPWIIDFGLAEPVNKPIHSRAGTPGYMDPEMVGGYAQPDAAADIFSWCATMHELYTGKPIMNDREKRWQSEWNGSAFYDAIASRMRSDFSVRSNAERNKNLEDLIVDLVHPRVNQDPRRASAEEVHQRLVEICDRSGTARVLDWNVDYPLSLPQTTSIIMRKITETQQRKSVWLQFKGMIGGLPGFISAARSRVLG